MASKRENDASGAVVAPFPPGIPKPHAARNWLNSVESVLTQHKLTDVARKTLPPGMFDKLYSCSSGIATPAISV